MASLSTPVRHVYRVAAPSLRLPQRRWAQVHDIRFLATHQSPDRKVLDKYREKLEQKAKAEGKNDIDELKAAYQHKIIQLRKKAIVPGANAPLSTNPVPQSTSLPFQPPPPPKPQPPVNKSSAEAKAGIKTLSSFIDVAKTLELPPKGIEYIWRLRHANVPNSLCAVIPIEVYREIQQAARKHPQFILPIPREGQGAEIHFLQWTSPSPTTATVMFTHLAEFKLRGEFAQPHTTVTHHLDLADPKGLVLLQGTVTENRGVSVEEGKWLLMCLQKFYGQNSGKTLRRKLMQQFSEGDNNFKVEELLEEAEKIA